MAYAIDLNERQSSRTLQQAIRRRAAIRIFPRTWADERCLICHLAGEDDQNHAGSDHLVLDAPTTSILPFQDSHGIETAASTEKCEADEDDAGSNIVPLTDDDLEHAPTTEVTPDEFGRLRGVYCDAQLLLGENRYLFCSDVIGVAPPGDGGRLWRVELYRPATIQVMQRRRFWRFRPARSSRVEMRWRNDYGHKGIGIGWLCNVSPDGVACRTDAQFSDLIYIGMNVTVTFKIDPSSSETFTLEGTVCNKMPAGTNGKFVLGMQFVPPSGSHDASRPTLERLRRQLMDMQTRDRHASKGADT